MLRTDQMVKGALFLLCCLVVTGCAVPSAELDPSPIILDRWSGIHGGSDGSSTIVVRDVQAWRSLWHQVGQEPPTEFDPTRQVAMAIFIGQRSTGGYSVEIAGIHQEGGKLRIEYRERMPQAGMMVAQVITSPWTIVLVSPSFSSTPVDFVSLNSRGNP